MADKRADQHRDLDRQDQTPDKSHRFINEKIVRQPMTRRQIARKILLTTFLCRSVWRVVGHLFCCEQTCG